MLGPLIAFLALIGLTVLWCFFNFPPKYANEKQLSAFNWMVIGVCAMICLAWVAQVGAILQGSVDEEWIKPLAIAGALGIEVVFLGIALLVRNFWIFKPPSRPGF